MTDNNSTTVSEAALATTNQNQARAADPTASAWVSANAGTGKTYVLTRRVLRLLLNGTSPDQILCLTYTKAAAAEMSRRVFDELAEWAVEAPETLAETLTKLEGTPPSAHKQAIAPTLFARAIETPGGLKVQTIHAFCERLLQRFPLEAGVAPDFAILDEDEQKDLLTQSIDQVLTDATDNPGEPLHNAMVRAVTYAVDDSFDQLLRSILSRRGTLLAMLQAGEQMTGPSGSHIHDPIDGIAMRLKVAMKLPPDATLESINQSRANIIAQDELPHLISILSEGLKTDEKNADALTQIASLPEHAAERAAHFETFFLTTTGAPRKSMMTKKPSEAHPDVAKQLADAQNAFVELTDQAGSLAVIDATTAIIRLADAIFSRYTDGKLRRAALDYDDLILKTVSLLSSERDAQWVLYKLDNGLEHILVDEAQDTSPVQWRIVARLAGEFFSGHGITEKTRTLFAVGDEKQSIYGFQGARPEMFARMGDRFRKEAQNASHTLHRVPLTMSFRTVAPVLDAVDATFHTPAARAGITATDDPISHAAFRANEPGLVEIWQTETPGEPEQVSPWRPLDETSTPLPIERLANRIAATIKGWIDTGTTLASTGAPIIPGDILLLVRRRYPVASAMIRALKAVGIPVAGADRIRITEQIAVMDLMALGDFVLMPDDDLALATILKSPLIGLDDDDLLQLAHHRKGTLWTALLHHAKTNESFERAAEAIKAWRRRADYAPPFEFFSLLLDSDGRRPDMLRRLGPEAGDAIDEFLNQAVQYDHNHPPSLQGFLEWLRRGGPEIRRDMEQGRDEVRIMTVHGAKGLEAPIVFLPDTCATASGGRGPTVLPLATNEPDIDEDQPLIWSIKGTSSVSAVKDAKDRNKQRDDEEYRRLLYVAMTRARDRLYIAGYEGKTKLAEHCWYNLVFKALTPNMTEVTTDDGHTIWRSEKSGETPPPQEPDVAPAQTETPPMPDWFTRPAAQERIRSIPVMPSRIVPLEEDDAIDALSSDTPASPLRQTENNRFQRGLLTHALLQHLPDLPTADRQQAADAFVASRGPDLTDRVRDSIVAETMQILEADTYTDLFADGSQAEVAIAAEVPNPDPAGRPLHVTGTIDRLVVDNDLVRFIDYKTNRPPPRDAADVLPAYLAQLAAYRLVLRQLYPGRKLEASLLWTDGARIMTLGDEQLDAVEPLLWSSRNGLEAAIDASYVQIN